MRQKYINIKANKQDNKYYCCTYNLIMWSKMCCYTTDISKCEILGLTRNKTIKLGYICIIFSTYLILLITNSFVNSSSQNYGDCCNFIHSLQKIQCIRHTNTLIAFMAVAALHLAICCCMFCKNEKIKVINQGLWLIKVVLVGLFALCLWHISSTAVFRYLDYCSLWGANLLYICESIVFVDLVYKMDSQFQQYATNNKKIHILKAIFSFTLIISSIFICFISFQYNAFYVCCINAVAIGLFLVLAFLRLFRGNSVLVGAIISLTINVLGFYIDKDSEHTYSDSFSSFLSVLKIILVCFLLMGMLCEGSNKLRTRKSSLNQWLGLNTSKTQQDNRYVSSNKWAVYHYIMMLIVCSIPAALSWSYIIQEQMHEWVDISNITSWGSIIVLYLWSLICCKVFPDQDFSDLEHYFREYQLQ